MLETRIIGGQKVPYMTDEELKIETTFMEGKSIPVVTSRQVAENFEKNHKEVIRAIENHINTLGGAQNCASLFIESKYQHVQNKQWYKEYLLTKDGFAFAIMSFTGEEAAKWKLKYIEAFNKMEEHIKGQAKPLSAMDQLKLQYQVLGEHEEKLNKIDCKIDDLENNLPLFNVECKELQAAVRKKGIDTLGGKGSQAYKDNSLRGKVYADIQHQLKREFGVTRYEAIKRSQLDKAIEIVTNYKAPYVLEDEIIKVNNQIDFGEVI